MLKVCEPYPLEEDPTTWVCEVVIQCGGRTILLSAVKEKVEPPLSDATRDAMIHDIALAGIQKMGRMYAEAYHDGVDTPDTQVPDTLPDDL